MCACVCLAPAALGPPSSLNNTWRRPRPRPVFSSRLVLSRLVCPHAPPASQPPASGGAAARREKTSPARHAARPVLCCALLRWPSTCPSGYLLWSRADGTRHRDQQHQAVAQHQPHTRPRTTMEHVFSAPPR